MGILICTFNLFHQAETIVEASNITDEVSVEVISENNERQGNKTTKKIKTNKKKLYEKKECDVFSRHDFSMLEKGYFTNSGRYFNHSCSKCAILFVTSKKYKGFLVSNKTPAYYCKICEILLCSKCHIASINSNGRSRRLKEVSGVY